ncbi:hypothetical protein [Ideonella sp. YS5]|uniref:hypothetical protein n=1 Tax=Ideonella sp. YS5 TaxID=3453714 RepID=UPI003EEDB155
MASASGSGRLPSMEDASASRSGARSKPSSSASFSPAAEKRSINWRAIARAPSVRRGPTMASAAASTALGALPSCREACAAASAVSPCRFRKAPTATLTSRRSFSPPGSFSKARPTFASSVYWAASSTDTPFRRVTCVFESICDTAEASFIASRANTAPTCRSQCLDLEVVRRDCAHGRQVQFRRQLHAHAGAEPGLELHRPLGGEIRLLAVGRHHRRERGGNVGDGPGPGALPSHRRIERSGQRLGLAIAKEICARHGISIQLMDAPGGGPGLCVELWWPPSAAAR